MSERGIVSERDHIYADIERCRLEIAVIEAQILAGHPDLEGLCLALADWSGELRLLQGSDEASDAARSAPGYGLLRRVGPVTRPDSGGRDTALGLCRTRGIWDQKQEKPAT